LVYTLTWPVSQAKRKRVACRTTNVSDFSKLLNSANLQHKFLPKLPVSLFNSTKNPTIDQYEVTADDALSSVVSY
jgi:hypothetical protein